MTMLSIMCGPAFSGKSTLARKIAERTGSRLIAFDTMWIEEDKKHSIPKDAEGWRYIRDKAQEEILQTLKEGVSVVYDDNNPKRDHREELKRIAETAGAEACVVYLDTSLVIICEREKANRISQDRHDVEPENFEKVLNDMEIPTADENLLVFAPDMNIEGFLSEIVSRFH
jgi:predicted kinase